MCFVNKFSFCAFSFFLSCWNSLEQVLTIFKVSDMNAYLGYFVLQENMAFEWSLWKSHSQVYSLLSLFFLSFFLYCLPESTGIYTQEKNQKLCYVVSYQINILNRQQTKFFNHNSFLCVFYEFNRAHRLYQCCTRTNRTSYWCNASNRYKKCAKFRAFEVRNISFLKQFSLGYCFTLKTWNNRIFFLFFLNLI